MREWFINTILFVVGLVFSVVAAIHVQKLETRDIQGKFEHVARTQQMMLKQHLEMHENQLTSVGNFYLSSEYVSRDEFMQFTAQRDHHKEWDHIIGWVAYDGEAGRYSWAYMNPEHEDGEGNTGNIIAGNAAFYDLIEQTVKRGSLSYFFIKKDLAADYIGKYHFESDTENIVIALNPVYHQLSRHTDHESSGPQHQSLAGISYMVFPLCGFVEETKKIYGDSGLSNLEIFQAGNGGETAEFSSKLLTTFGTPPAHSEYAYADETHMGQNTIVWRFTPNNKFRAEYHGNAAYKMFAVLMGLTIMFMALRILFRRMQLLKISENRATELNRLKTDFLATMSHEIRTPMNGILGMAELVLGARPSQQIEGYARTIINSGESLQQIIDDILDFSKIGAGKLDLDPMPVDMLDLVDNVVSLYSVKARDKAIEIAVRYVPGSEQFVYADPVRVRQVLANLVSNAIKFTDKGHVAITVSEDKKARDIPEGFVRLHFEVEDTGVGISLAEQTRIFEKFSQADNSTTRKYGGTGLGLSICKSLLELMGSTITVESSRGKGTVFRFSLIVRRNNTESRTVPDLPALRGVRILVVDDLPIIRQIVCEQLALAGIACHSAESGANAMEKILAARQGGMPYDIVIIDYLMPEMNGEMLASLINDHDDLRDTCLVMLTAAGNPLADEDFVHKGFSAYIAKPVRGDALLEDLSIIWTQYSGGVRDRLIRLHPHHNNKEAESDAAPTLPGAHILIAEDNLVNQVFIKEILEEMTVKYMIVSNGADAVKAVKDHDFDLIIMDCLMPEMDGFEATRRICEMKRRGETRVYLPIIALTANAMKDDRDKCLAAGMDDYIAKPVRKRELQNIVHQWISGKPTRNENAENDGGEGGNGAFVPAGDAGAGNDNIVLLDREAVKSARSILKGRYDEMLTVYITNSWEYVADMENAVKAGDIGGLIRPSHTLKSTSRQMGAFALSDLAKDIEMASKQMHAGEITPDMNVLAGMVEKFKPLLCETKKALDAMAA